MISWGELTEETRAALAWAAAMEPLDVGTRTLLIGITRVGGGASDPDQLLRVFGCPKERLFDSLQRAASPNIRPYAAKPASLRDLPKLSPNCRQVLERAAAIARSCDSAQTALPHVFAAMLNFRRSTAFRGLEEVLDADLGEIRDLHLRHLKREGPGTFASLLQARYPDKAQAMTPGLLAHAGRINALCFAPDEGELATAGAAGQIYLFQLGEEQQPPRVLSPGRPDAPSAISYTADGSQLVCGTENGLLWAWQLQDSDPAKTRGSNFARFSRPVSAIAAGGELLAVTDRGGTLFVFTRNLGIQATYSPGDADSPGIAISTLAFSPDGGRLVSGDRLGVFALWDPLTGEKLSEHQAGGSDRSGVLAAAFERDGRTVIFVLEDGSVGRWNPFDQMSHRDLGDLSHGPPTAAALSLDGRLEASAHYDDSVRISNGDETRYLGSHLAPVSSLAVSPSSSWIASGDQEGRVQIFRAEGGHRTDSAVEWQFDSPLRGVESDKLERGKLARTISMRLEQIARDRDGESFLLHLDGPWGAGKSTILGLLGRELEKGDLEWLSVKVDAWRQSRVGPPWWVLLTSLRAAQRANLGPWGRVRLRFAEAGHRLGQAWLSYLVSFLVAVAALGVFALVKPAAGGLGGLVQLLSGTIALVSTVWLLANTAARFLMWESATAARMYEQSHQNPMEALAAHFAWLMRRIGKRVIFFVDDLDRCDEQYVVDMLDSIQTLVRDNAAGAGPSNPPYFVVAADGRWIRCSYEHVYAPFEQAVREPGRPLGYLFLDKIFQLTVQVPMIGRKQQQAYLDHLLDRADQQPLAEGADLEERKRMIRTSSNQEEVLRVVNEAPAASQPELRGLAVEQLATPEVSRHTEHELQKFSALLEPNPRSMKRFVNAYSVGLSSALLEERQVEPEQLALWTIVRMRWPDLADHLSLHPELVEALRPGTGGVDGAIPQALLPLSGDTGLAAVLGFGEQSLDEAAIRSLCGGP